MESLTTTTADEKALEALEALVSEADITTITALPTIRQTVAMANAVSKLREGLRPMLPTIMMLQGHRLGFRTDKDRSRDGGPGTGYPAPVVLDVAVEAFLRGFRLVDNEINIIGGNLYVTKNGLARKLREMPGLTDLERSFSVPQTGARGAVVHAKAAWKYQGRQMEVEQDLAIKTYDGQGADAILGKARRKLDALVWERLTGSELSTGEIEEPLDITPRENTATRLEQVLQQPGIRCSGSGCEVSGQPSPKAPPQEKRQDEQEPAQEPEKPKGRGKGQAKAQKPVNVKDEREAPAEKPTARSAYERAVERAHELDARGLEEACDKALKDSGIGQLAPDVEEFRLSSFLSMTKKFLDL